MPLSTWYVLFSDSRCTVGMPFTHAVVILVGTRFGYATRGIASTGKATCYLSSESAFLSIHGSSIGLYAQGNVGQGMESRTRTCMGGRV
jgi:hypothetical protein